MRRIILGVLCLLLLCSPALAEEVSYASLGVAFAAPEGFQAMEQAFEEDAAHGVALMNAAKPFVLFALRKEASAFDGVALAEASQAEIDAVLEALLLPPDAFTAAVQAEALTGSAHLSATSTEGNQHHLITLQDGYLYDFAVINGAAPLDQEAYAAFMQWMQTVRFLPGD